MKPTEDTAPIADDLFELDEPQFVERRKGQRRKEERRGDERRNDSSEPPGEERRRWRRRRGERRGRDRRSSPDDARKRPGRLRRWFVRPVLWGLAALAILIFVLQMLLDTRWVRDGARRIISEQLSEALQREVGIVDLSFELLPLSVEIWGFTISGLEPEHTNFLEVPWASIDADLNALQDGRIHLQAVRVQRPRVFLEYFPDGINNILKTSRDGPPKPRRFDVFIDRVEIDRAEFGLEQHTVSMSLDADSVRTRMHGIGEMNLGGQIDAHNVVLRLPNARPITLAVSGRGFLRRGEVEIEAARISGPDFAANGKGLCEYPRGQREMRKCLFQIRGRTRGEMLAGLGYFQDLTGALEFDGSLAWRPFLTGWRSRLSADEVVLWDRQITDLEGSLIADRYGFRIGIDEGRYADGQLSGTVGWESKKEGKPWNLNLDFTGLRLDQVLADQAIPTAGYASRLDGSLEYSFLAGLSQKGNGNVQLQVHADPEQPGLPVRGAFPLRIEDGITRAEAVNLSSERQNILASGWYDLSDRDGAYDYEITTADIAELTPLLLLEPSPEPLLWLPTAGRGKLDGTLYVRPEDVAAPIRPDLIEADDGAMPWVVGSSAEMRLRLTDVVAPGAAADNITGSMHLGSDAAHALRLELFGLDEALMLQGKMPYEPTPENPIELTLDGFGWPVAAARPWLDFQLPVDGKITGRMAVRVDDVASYGDLEGTVAPASLRLPRPADARREPSLTPLPADIELDSLTTRFTWDADQIRYERLDLRAPSGEVAMQGTLDWTSGALDLELTSDTLQIANQPLARYLPRSDIRGEVSVDGRLGGWLHEPRLDLVIAADTLALGPRVLEGRPSRLEISWAAHQFRTRGRLLDMVTLDGGGLLRTRQADLKLHLDGNDVRGLAELLLEDPPEDLTGNFTGNLHIQGDEARGVTVDLQLDGVDVELRERKLTNTSPVRARLEAEHLSIESLHLTDPSTNSEFILGGVMGYTDPTNLDLNLQSRLASHWLELLEIGFDVDGAFDVLGKIGGSFEAPTFSGQGELHDGRLVLSPDWQIVIEDLSGIVLFHPGQAILDGLEGRLGGGRVILEGETTLEENPEYRVQLSGSDLALRYLEGWSLGGDVELALASTERGHLLDGRAQLDSLTYGEDIRADFEQLMRGFLQRQRLEVAPTDSVLSTVELNVDIEGTDAVRIRNNIADLEGSAQLLMRGNLARPVLYGEVEIAPEGTLLYNSTDYEIERGRIVFADPYELDPEIDLVAVTRVREFDVTLAVDGTFDRLQTRFSSEPPLPDLEVFRLLASGGDETTETTGTVLQRSGFEEDTSTSAATFLYGQAASVIGQRVNTLFGFDKFRIDPLTGSGDQLSKARVTVGKRLSKDVFVTFSADPSSTEDQRLRIEWQVSPSLSLILTQNGDDGYSADARWETSF